MPPGISLVGPNAFNVRLKSGKPRAALVFDMKHGRVLYKRNPLRRMPIASLTKIMTALVVVDATRPREQVRITQARARLQRARASGVLPKGKKVPVEGLLTGLLLLSGNDAAIALADHVAGSERRFVRTMNRRARRARPALHAVRVLARARAGQPLVRARPGGADAAGDARAAHRAGSRAASRSPSCRSRSRAAGCTCPRHNPLLRLGYRGTIGLKTG